MIAPPKYKNDLMTTDFNDCDFKQKKKNTLRHLARQNFFVSLRREKLRTTILRILRISDRDVRLV